MSTRQLGCANSWVFESWPTHPRAPTQEPLSDTAPRYLCYTKALYSNPLCTQQKKILYPKWWYFGIVCILQMAKGFSSYHCVLGFLLK